MIITDNELLIKFFIEYLGILGRHSGVGDGDKKIFQMFHNKSTQEDKRLTLGLIKLRLKGTHTQTRQYASRLN